MWVDGRTRSEVADQHIRVLTEDGELLRDLIRDIATAAAGVGFEPTNGCPLCAFKAHAIGR